MRPLLSLILAAALTGCATSLPPADDAPVLPAGDGDAETRQHRLAWSREGFVVARLANDEPPFTIQQGDSATFCFVVPADAVRLTVTYAWDAPQHMWLQLNEPGDPEAKVETDGITPPLTVVVEKPVAGTWFGYGGPAAVGGATAWNMTLALDMGREASLDETKYDGEACY